MTATDVDEAGPGRANTRIVRGHAPVLLITG